MQKQPEQDEIRVGFASHHRFEIELDICLAGQTDVVAQQPKTQTVGDDPPEMLVAPVQQLLKEAVGTGPHTARGCLNTPVEIHVASDKMNGCLLPGVADCIRLAADFFGLGCLKASIVE